MNGRGDHLMNSWEDHLAKFTKATTGLAKGAAADLYVPKDPSDNNLRHYGMKIENTLYLNYTELLYLYSPKVPLDANPETKAYFELKNAGFNLLFDLEVPVHNREVHAYHREAHVYHREVHVYHRTHHFNRLKEKPIGCLTIRNKEELVSAEENNAHGENGNNSGIVGVFGENSFCYLQVEELEALDHETPSDLLKSSRVV